MENFTEDSLPQIFRFSTLCNILPYYGKLHQWVWMLNWISNKTKKIWRDNKEMFIECGKLYKDQIKLNCEGFSDTAREYILHRYIYYNHFVINNNSLKNLLLYYLPENNSDIVFF